ncbi:retrovirus-related pol polyprotein from transposon TNT 1-94 [Tanacetum coccineum]
MKGSRIMDAQTHDGQPKLFLHLQGNYGVTNFGSDLCGNIIGKGTISNDSLKIDNVEHVDNLGFNLLSIGQICDNKCRVTFSEHDSEITKDGKVIEPKNVNEALGDESWIVAMQEELNQFIANDVWELVPQPRNMTIIGTKWVFRNKLDENGIVSRNKARLVAQGYNQQEGIDYDETYAPVARLESIRILLAYACALDFKLFQMDVKSAFLNGFINEEVYVAQPPGFIDFEKPDHVYKLKKALYGLKQAPKACILKMLKKFGLEDSKPIKTPMSSDTKLTKDEECESVDSTKYRGMIGSLLYLTASRPDIMFNVCLCARFQEAPKTSHLEAVKRIFRYIKGTTHLGLRYPKGTNIETVVYADSDHAGDYVDRKSTSGICTFVECCLTSWFSKKQTTLAISTTEAEYVSVEKACQQALWMKQALIDYDIRLNDVPIMCENKGAIDLNKNPVQHSRTKHIEIRHHFLRDNVQKGHISIKKVLSVDNIAEILTKPLKRESFNYLYSSPCSTPCRDNLNTSSEVTMARATSLDHQKTRNYIPIKSNEFNQPLLNTMANLEKRSSSPTLNHPSSSHLLVDPIDENDDESSHSNPSSPSQNISSSSNNVSRVHQNPPRERHYLNTYLSETINLLTQQRDAHREGLRLIEQALKNMMGGKQK